MLEFCASPCSLEHENPQSFADVHLELRSELKPGAWCLARVRDEATRCLLIHHPARGDPWTEHRWPLPWRPTHSSVRNGPPHPTYSVLSLRSENTDWIIIFLFFLKSACMMYSLEQMVM